MDKEQGIQDGFIDNSEYVREYMSKQRVKDQINDLFVPVEFPKQLKDYTAKDIVRLSAKLTAVISLTSGALFGVYVSSLYLASAFITIMGQ